MDESDGARMEHLSICIQCFPLPVLRIPGEGVADIFHMDADLMGAAGLEYAFHQSELIEAFNHIEMRHRLPAVVHYGHCLALIRVPADRRFDCSFVMGDYTMDQRGISARHGLIHKLIDKGPVRHVVFGHHEQPACILVDPVHYTGPQFAVDAGQVVQLMHQTVDECAGSVAGGGVHHHAAPLVHNGHMVVFMNDIKTEVFGDDVTFNKLTLVHFHQIIRLHLVIRLHSAAVNQYYAFFDTPLHVAAGCIRHDFSKETVDPETVLCLCHFNFLHLFHLFP